MKPIFKIHKIFIYIFTLTITALMYVNQQVLIYQIGLKVKENTCVYSKLVDYNRILIYNVLNLRSPISLETKLLAGNVELDMPCKWQIVRLKNSPRKIIRKDASKRGLFSNPFIFGREVEASPNNK